MSQTETKNEAPVITKDDSQLTEELRAEIKASTVQENFNRAKKAREDLRSLLSQAELKDGSYDFSKVEGMTDAEAYQKAQNLQAVFLEINHINNRKLLSANLEQTSRSDAVGAPAMQMFDAVEGGRAPRDVFERFKQLHNLDTDKLFDNHKHIAAKATIDDFLNVAPGDSNSGAATGGNGGITYGTGDAGSTLPTLPTRTGSPVVGGHGSVVSPSGLGVNRYLSEQIPAQRAYRKRDMLNPMIARIPCPPVTDTLRYIAEELATGAPGSSNRVAGRKEGERAPLQDMSTREIAVTVIKRMISATVTNEQLTDTLQARQIMNDNILMKIQEDFEDQVINGNGNANNGNMNGIFWRPSSQASGSDLRSVDAADPYYKQLFSRTDGETRTVLDFYLDALTQYLKPRPDTAHATANDDGLVGLSKDNPGSDYGAGRSPTHIVLGLAEKMRLMGQKDNQGRYLWANTVEGDFISLWGMPILISDYIPNEQGLILAVDELAVVVKAGVEWNFGLKDDDLVRDQTTMVAKHRANLLVKRPRTVMILDNLGATAGGNNHDNNARPDYSS